MSNFGMGRRIRARRTQLGISLRELARRCDLVPSHLSRIERNPDHEIRTDTLRLLAFHLQVSADWILGVYEEEREDKPAVAST